MGAFLRERKSAEHRQSGAMLRAVAGVSQGAKQRCTLLQSEDFGASGGFYFGFGHGGAEFGLRIIRLEIVPQGLALLAEGKPQKIDESIICEAVRVEA